MDLGLTGKVAIVTGGSKGIGKAIAQELAGEGVDVAICARDRRVLEEAAKTLAAATRRRIVPIVCDMTSTKSVQDLVEATVAQFGRVDILVNKRIVNISPRRRRSPPGWPAAPDVICHTQTPPLQEPPSSRCHSLMLDAASREPGSPCTGTEGGGKSPPCSTSDTAVAA